MTMQRFFQNIWQREGLLWAVYALAAVMITAQRFLLRRSDGGYTAYENYIIFKNSFAHLVQGLNPYARYESEQWDLYKYSPAFSLFMAPFSFLPDWAGLGLWNLLNALTLLWAIMHVPLSRTQKRFMGWFVLLELTTSLQNSQSNGLTAAMILLTWVALERGRPWSAGWWAAAGAFLKVFGGFAALPALLYAIRFRFIAAMPVWGCFLALAPMAVIGPDRLLQVYKWWWELLQQDHAASIGLSVAGWLESWFGWMPGKMWITGVGFILLVGSIGWGKLRGRPVLKDAYPGRPLKEVPGKYYALVWASILIWVVIFNHKAESPTFIIALCGVALWYLSDPKPAVWKKILLGISYALVSLSPTDVFPPVFRQSLIQPYVLKAVPCIAIWILITWQLFRLPINNEHTIRGH